MSNVPCRIIVLPVPVAGSNIGFDRRQTPQRQIIGKPKPQPWWGDRQPIPQPSPVDRDLIRVWPTRPAGIWSSSAPRSRPRSGERRDAYPHQISQ
jgi:hypothetical protein